MAFVVEGKKMWDYEAGRTDVPPLKTFWRILHLLGNAWVHNALMGLGRPGLTSAEMRFFLCRDLPKRAKLHPRLQEVKDQLSDKPALEFHLPPYNTPAQLAADLRKLEKAGYIIKHGKEWSLCWPAYQSLVNEWEGERDVELLRRYDPDDLVRVDHHVRLYGPPRSLLSEEEQRELASVAEQSSWLLAAAFVVHHKAKVRAWTEVRRQLESDVLPRSISGRILNLFWLWEESWVGPDRVWHPDTPALIGSEMLRVKHGQLLRRQMKRTIDDRALFDTIVGMNRKYFDVASLPKVCREDLDLTKIEPPKLAEEPPFASEAEETLFHETVECICNPKLDEGERAKIMRNLVRRGVPDPLLTSLRLLWRSAMTPITLVSTSPIVPLARNPTFWRLEQKFFDRLYGPEATTGK